MNRFTRIAMCVVLGIASVAGAAEPPFEAIQDARDLLSKGDVNAAIERYEQARSVDPESPELAYNLGVAKYRAGKYGEAAALFKEAAAKAKADLAAKAMFNQGTSTYADALTKLPKDGAQAAPPMPTPGAEGQPNPLDEAIGAVEQSVTHFRDAIAADPHDADSRANAERAWKLLKKLREEKEKQEQQQQQQQQQNQDQKDQDQKNQDQKQQQNQNQDGKENQPNQDQGSEDKRPPEDEKRNQSKSDQSQKDQGQERESDQKDQQPKQDQKQDQKKDQKQKGKPQPRDGQQQDPKNGDAKGGQAQRDEQKMSREDAERLLQIARDKEKERREQKARQERARQQPVSKDW